MPYFSWSTCNPEHWLFLLDTTFAVCIFRENCFTSITLEIYTAHCICWAFHIGYPEYVYAVLNIFLCDLYLLLKI